MGERTYHPFVAILLGSSLPHLVSRSSVLSWDSTRLFNAVTNQSIRRPALVVGHQKQQQLFNCFPALLCWKGPGSVMCRIRVLPARSKAWVGRCEGLSCLMGAVLLKVF